MAEDAGVARLQTRQLQAMKTETDNVSMNKALFISDGTQSQLPEIKNHTQAYNCIRCMRMQIKSLITRLVEQKQGNAGEVRVYLARWGIRGSNC